MKFHMPMPKMGTSKKLVAALASLLFVAVVAADEGHSQAGGSCGGHDHGAEQKPFDEHVAEGVRKLEEERAARKKPTGPPAMPESAPSPPRSQQQEAATRGHEYTGVGNKQEAQADFDNFADGMARVKKFKGGSGGSFQKRFGVHPMAIVGGLVMLVVVAGLRSFKVRYKSHDPP